MITKILKSVFILALASTLFSFDLPKAWFKAGNNPNAYEMGLAINEGHNGGNAATIRSINKRIWGFGTLMQNCLPDKYLGKKVRMTGFVKSRDVNNWAALWFRVDGEKDEKHPLSFDNMHDRAITGTTEWTKYEIILDVPKNATNLAYGALIAGTGQIWFDNIRFEIVEHSQPATGTEYLNEPSNLDFKE